MKSIVLPYSAIHSGSLILVNAEHPLPMEYQEPNLASPNVKHSHPIEWQEPDLASPNAENSGILLERRVILPLTRLMNAIGGWTDIALVSGWRSRQEQREIYKRSFAENGAAFTERFVALPDHSEHQTGFAVDLGFKKPNMDMICPDFPDSGVCGAFHKKAAAYGFIERYPKNKESVTKIAHESWHFRFVGIPHAAIMAQMSLTLEEYIDYVKQFPLGSEALVVSLNQGSFAIRSVKAEKNKAICLEVDPRFPYSVSGNNIDGFILTEWRVVHDN